MLRFPQSEIQRDQQRLMDQCKQEIYSKLDSCLNIIETLVPTAIIPNDPQKINILLTDFLKTSLPEIKAWIQGVLEDAYRLDQKSKLKSLKPEPIQLPFELSLIIIRSITDILSKREGLTERAYYFISQLGNAMELEANVCLQIIEKAQKKIRNNFVDYLLNTLTAEECFQCAVLFYQAVQADDRIHPAEFTYLDNINHLYENDPVKFEELEKASLAGSPLPNIQLNKELATQLFTYLVEIVLCDQNYDPNESRFIKEIGCVFGFSNSRQKKIIQTVASLVLVKSTLF